MTPEDARTDSASLLRLAGEEFAPALATGSHATDEECPYGLHVTFPVCVALKVLVAGQPPSTIGSR